MRRAMTMWVLFLVSLCVLSGAWEARAYPSKALKTKWACAACHVNAAGGSTLTEVGKKYMADSMTAAPKDVKGADFVGTNKCKMCHSKEFKAWQQTAHANAWVGLQKADPKFAADLAGKLGVKLEGKPETVDGCIMCHVTGFHLPGGYPGADSAKTAALVNVTCEGCHGPGSLHIAAKAEERKKFINRAVSAKLCVQCHTAVTSPKFNAEDYMKRGVHVVAASAK